MKENIVLEDSKVTEDILIVQDSIIVVSENKEFTQDSEVKDVHMEEQSLLVSSLEEENIKKASFEDISNELEVFNEEVQSILNLSFISNNMVKIMQEA